MNSGKINKAGWKTFEFGEAKAPLKNGMHQRATPEIAPQKKLQNFNFEYHVTPQTTEDLAVHNKKISDIELWLKTNVTSRLSNKKSSMLLITGPTGCGKTITVKVLCKKLNIEIREWVNPIDKDKDYAIGQTSQLLEFLSGSKYPSLLCINKPSIILIEDFPNSVIHDPTEFILVLEKCNDCKFSVIFICTDASNLNLNLAQTLFPDDMRAQFSINNISFNSTSNTLLKKALKRAQTLIEKHLDVYNIPNQSTIDNIISSSMGDIRCAVNQFYFTCLKASGYTSIEDMPLKPSNKRKRKTKMETKNETFLKNERLSFFHGIGRVLYPKREEKNGSWRLKCDITALIEEISVQPNTFNSFVHANYLKYFGDINDICNAADVLSFAERFLSNWQSRDDILQYGLWVPMLGLMVYNEHRVSKWNQITAPKKYTKTLNHDTNLKSLNVIDFCYYNIINKCDYSNKLKS